MLSLTANHVPRPDISQRQLMVLRKTTPNGSNVGVRRPQQHREPTTT